ILAIKNKIMNKKRIFKTLVRYPLWLCFWLSMTSLHASQATNTCNGQQCNDQQRKSLDDKTKEAWWQAIKEGDIETMEDILNHYKVDMNEKNEEGETPLHLTAAINSDKVATILIDRGARIEAEAKDKCTPLHFAAWKNSDKVATILIDRGARIEAEAKDKWTPLHLAAQENSDKVAT
ncbi:ankyrin repeat domain-containing protein, partial [Pseudoalteromonas sp.]|uniref:ankyrin repeat domain-containing protein n=1 Tax=Pseudoalteromonas sp. TaxID=53249 RepID=UPI002354BB4E